MKQKLPVCNARPYKRLTGAPTEAILAMAKEKGCDLIVMASHGERGIAGVILGSVTAKVLAQAHVPVTVYR